jgi:hypothetical protein
MKFSARLQEIERNEHAIISIIQKYEIKAVSKIVVRPEFVEQRQRVFLDGVTFRKGNGLWVYTSQSPLLSQDSDDELG